MEILNYDNQNLNPELFQKVINTARKENKNRWYAFTGYVCNKRVKVKGFNTWLQIYEVDGLNQPTVMDIPVKKFNEDLLRPFAE